jgi:LAO/AO transport system kinase
VSRAAQLCAALASGDRRVLARLLTIVEDGSEQERREVIATLHPIAPRARVIGITGAPGVGKSSVTNAIIMALRADGRRVAVIAVDPSSPFTGGALLGDRIRMQVHHADDGVFVRSMAARSRLGGLAAAAPEAALVFAAAGYDDIIVETVGVGQSEIDVAALADTTVLVMAPGMGDAVQAAKAGILEVADVLVVNKADQPGAGMLESELRTMLEVGHAALPPGDGVDGTVWVPPILRTVAVRSEGVRELVEAIGAHAEREPRPRALSSADTVDASGGTVDARELLRSRRWVLELALGVLRERLGRSERLDELAAAVVDRRVDPLSAADRLLATLRVGEHEVP